MIRRLSTTAARSLFRTQKAPIASKPTAKPVAKPAPKVASKPVAKPAPKAAPKAAAPAPIKAAAAAAPPAASEPLDTEDLDLSTGEDIASTLDALESPADQTDWSTSFAGLGSKAFSDKAIDILLAPVVAEDVEITPDGLLYLPEIKYRRILNRAFGPGGWGIAPRTKTMVTNRKVTREYGLVCQGRLVSISRGEQDFFSPEGVTTAMEGCKSNALMRCCKDLGIASELWDPAFIRVFKKDQCDQKYFEKKKRFVWKRKDRPWEYPYV